jgi:hypothetical protein
MSNRAVTESICVIVTWHLPGPVIEHGPLAHSENLELPSAAAVNVSTEPAV